MMKRNLLFSVFMSCLISAPIMAQQPNYRVPGMGYGHATPPMRGMPQPQRPKPYSEVEEAGMVLKAGLEKLLSFFSQKNAPAPQQIEAFLNQEIAPYFNFEYMAKWASGRYYDRMNEQQRKAIETELKTRFLTTMAQKLGTFDNQTVRYLAPKVLGRGQVQLSVAISNPGNYPARLDFRLYKDGSGWKVYDVSANGSSALMYYRQFFRQQLQRQRMPVRYR